MTSLSKHRDSSDAILDSPRLTRAESEVVIRYIKKLDARRFEPVPNYVVDMVNQLLAAHVLICDVKGPQRS